MPKLSDTTLQALRWLAPAIWVIAVILAAWRMGPYETLGIVGIASFYGIAHARKSWLYGYGGWMAALWLLSGKIGLVLTFALIYTKTGILDSSRVAIHALWPCTYFSVVTWTTVGFGDYVPTPAAQPFAAIEAMAGYIYMALAIGLIVQTMLETRTRSDRR